ncbi:DUF1684 domain-containing protein [Daejeonella oryzae]|uniref:DUF1684 domain-containing protein n=1 Tax=Daejeonella oryzae TaxID=1122943 RepID=UPI0004140860|nr:DUF1684 domain-containing protein [Daejeonella oryzae]
MRTILTFLFILLCNFSSYAQEINQGSYSQQIKKHRQEYKDDFLKETRSPLLKNDLSKLRFYKPDENYSVNAAVEILQDQQVFKMLTFDGSAKQYVRYALLKFKLQGADQILTLYQSIALKDNEQYKDYLFLPFTDLTNASSTYGGGRYIDLKIKDISSGNFQLDFNKAYNPYCAYSSGYSCPIPPEENDIKIAVKAGEKKFAGTKK